MIFLAKYFIMNTTMAVNPPKLVDVIVDVVTDVGAVPTTSTSQSNARGGETDSTCGVIQ